MSIPKYILYLLVPLPVALILSYYLSLNMASYLEHILLKDQGKELARVPDFEVQEAKLDRRAIDVLAYIDVGHKTRKAPLVAKSPKKSPEKPPSYRVQFVFVGKKNYAIINGRLLREGDYLSQEEKIVKITRKGVLLSGRWGKRWLYIVE